MKVSLLISSLPTQNTTTRMRVWRSLKASGAVTLRDGVYLLPAAYDEKFTSIGEFFAERAETETEKSFPCSMFDNIF